MIKEYLLAAFVFLALIAGMTIAGLDVKKDREVMDRYLVEHHCTLKELRRNVKMYRCDDDLSVWIDR